MVHLYKFGTVCLSFCETCLGDLTLEKVPGEVGRCVHCDMPSLDVIKKECSKIVKKVPKRPRVDTYQPVMYPSYDGVTDEISGTITVGTRRKRKQSSLA